MNILKKILEEKELAAIKDLVEENEKCLNQCEGACGSIKNGVCNCDDGILVQAIRKIQDYLSVVTDTNVGSKSNWIPYTEQNTPSKDGIYLVTCDDIEYPVKRMRFKECLWYWTYGIYDGKILAWMPLPKSYKGEEAAG